MAQNIHPQLHMVKVSCSCGHVFQMTCGIEKDQTVESCRMCHPAYTGKRREVELDAYKRFAAKYGNLGTASRLTSSKLQKQPAESGAQKGKQDAAEDKQSS
jgi:large subunit ribosomal protein L31